MLGDHESHPFGVTHSPEADDGRIEPTFEPDADHKLADGTHVWQAPPPPPQALPPTPPAPLSRRRRLRRRIHSLLSRQACARPLAWKQGGMDTVLDLEWPSRADAGALVPAHNMLGEVTGGVHHLTAREGSYLDHPVESDAEKSMIRRWMWHNEGKLTFSAAWRLTGAVDPLPDGPNPDGCPYERPRLVGFHGTSEGALRNIVRQGFDTPTREGLLGKRVYLAKDCSKAAHYSMTKDCNLLLVCHFDPGSMLVEGKERKTGWKEPEGWDTIKAIPPFVRSTPAEYGIKYQFGSDRIVPAYVVRFDLPKREAVRDYHSNCGVFPIVGYRCPLTKVLYRDETGPTLGSFGQNWE